MSIQGPNKELNSELSREQIMQAFDGVVDGSNNSPMKKAIVAEALESDATQSVVQAKYTQNLLNTYTSAADRASGGWSTGGSIGNTSDDQSPTSKYTEYQQQVLKQELFFSRLDQSEFKNKV